MSVHLCPEQNRDCGDFPAFWCHSCPQWQTIPIGEWQEETAGQEARPVASEFCWLVELFEPGGNSMGYYHTGFSDLAWQSRSTKDPYQARRYNSKEEAERAASELFSKAGVWRAIEHGFAAPPQTPAAVQGEAKPDDYKSWYVEAMIASNEAGYVGISAAETIRALAAQVEADPMDWPLPCDVKVGHVTMGKGVRLRTLITRMRVLYEMAIGLNADAVASRTIEQRTALFATFQAEIASSSAPPILDDSPLAPLAEQQRAAHRKDAAEGKGIWAGKGEFE
jgi:hypothetical protein